MFTVVFNQAQLDLLQQFMQNYEMYVVPGNPSPEETALVQQIIPLLANAVHS